MYFTTNELINPAGGNIEQFMVFEALVDGESRCVSYVGDNQDTIGINQVELRYGPFGFSNLGDCIKCNLFESPTPTPTITVTPTPTITVTPTKTPMPNAYYLYVRCDDETKYVAQTSPGPTITPNSTFINLNDNKCWKYLSVSLGYPSINPLYSVINYSGNYFTQTSNQIFDSCELCENNIPITTTTTLSIKQKYTINYSLTKSKNCVLVSGRILVNGVTKYNMSSTLLAGNYSGSIIVGDNDIITFEFNTLPPTLFCLPLKSTISLTDNNGIVNEYAEYGTSTQSIYETFTVDSNWLGNTIIIIADTI